MVTEDMGEDPLWVQVGAASLGALCIGIWIAIDFSWTLGVRMVGVSLAALIASLAHVLLSESAAKEHEKWSELDRKKNPERDWGWTNIAALDHEGDIVLGRGRVKRVLRQAAMVGDLAEKTGKTLEEWFADLDTLNAEYEQKHNTGVMNRNMKKHMNKNHGLGD